MPPATRLVADCSKARLSRYLRTLMDGKNDSKTKIGALVSTNATRVKAWTSGQRYMSPDIAFALGEGLRSDLGWKTSGVEFLWACGHWSEIIEILKYMSAGPSVDANGVVGGPDLAAMLYSWLPGTMLDFEKENIEARFFDIYGVSHERFWETIRPDQGFARSEDEFVVNLQRVLESVETGGREIFRYAADSSGTRHPKGHFLVDSKKALSELTVQVRSEFFFDRIVDAWERYNQGDLAGPSSILAAPNGTSAKIVEIELHVLDALIDAARKLNESIFPSYAIPRIWRMLAGWIDNVVPNHEVFTAALPDSFVSASEVQSRDWIDFIHQEYETPLD
jgi:hypothetical protein